jgi:hypothetical protein
MKTLLIFLLLCSSVSAAPYHNRSRTKQFFQRSTNGSAKLSSNRDNIRTGQPKNNRDSDPVLRVFIGKTLNDLAKWLERHGKTTLTAVSSKSDTRKERNPYE